MDAVSEFLAWYLAPWRRIGRAPFNTVVGVVSILPMLFSLGGMANSVGMAGHFMEAVKDVNSGNLSAVPTIQDQVNNLMGGGAEVAASFDWSAAVNIALMLLLIPLVRMRLRDIGWSEKEGAKLWHGLGLVLVYAAVVSQLMDLAGLGNLGIAATIAQFAMLAVLCVKGTVVAERTYQPPAPPPPSHGV